MSMDPPAPGARTAATQAADVVVVGGGMVGASLAALLGRRGLDVVLVEEQPATSADTPAAAPPDLRVSSVNLASVELFRAVGAWEPMTQHRVCPFRRVHAMDEHGGVLRFDARETGHDWFGWFVENRVILSGLREALAGVDTVRWITAAPVTLETDADRARLGLDNGLRLHAPLVVGADGAGSSIRGLAGIDVTARDYQTRALVTNVETELPQQDITWQRFTPEGPQAFLPLCGHRASLVWYARPETVQLLESLDDETLIAEITDAFPAELGGLRAVTGRASFAIRSQHATRYTGSRIALVGDAAHTIHPLAGQGLNLGLEGVNRLAAAILDARKHRRDPGTAVALADYERRHRPRALTMIAATDTLHRLFTAEAGVLPRLGNGVLRLADRLPPGRRAVMRHAMGLTPAGSHRPVP
ncbi:FAD-dependent oxidoreductase [Aquisalimonas lutea]|uniref:FAD-dependent oxidoreductase n=1 Tax=Aquisalimonas lutea TaxID=1327750 RepID=UPI0025B3876A|nr:FAD-dependent oxidoreductase [Aquisalimonas lutea]MDN3516822.1 FAD-dependent oxidoreductase [Aquisalimonas lutea]